MLQWKNGRLVGGSGRAGGSRHGDRELGLGKLHLGLVGARAMSPGAKHCPRGSRRSSLPVALLGFAVAVAAAVSFAVSPRDLATLAGIAGLLAASTLAERYPVPLDGIDTGGVSLGFVFCTAAIVLYGWEAGVVVGMAAPIMQLLEHRPPIRVAYNALGDVDRRRGRRGAAISPLRGDEAGFVFAQVVVAAFAFYSVNLLLISLVGRRQRRASRS